MAADERVLCDIGWHAVVVVCAADEAEPRRVLQGLQQTVEAVILEPVMGEGNPGLADYPS